MHAACWDIFLQNHALLATKNPLIPDLNLLGQIFASQELEGDGQGFKPTWTPDYGQAEIFHCLDGWSYHEEPEASQVRGLSEEMDELDFIVCDPEKVRGFDDVLGNPPVATYPLDEQGPPLNRHGAKEEIFQKLPLEILQAVLCFLPTPSVRNLRLASRTLAAVGLNTEFWRSRFSFPNEVCHVTLPENIKSKVRTVDWNGLYSCLLHPTGEESKWWENRNRISTLTTRLVQKLLSQGSERE